MNAAPPPCPQPLAAQWFDGRSSRAQPVHVVLRPGAKGPTLALHDAQTGALLHQFSHRQVGWPERWSARRAPPALAIDLDEHGSLRVADVPGWQHAMQAAGVRPSLAQHMQTRWPALLAVLLVVVAGLWSFYRFGTPWAARRLTQWVPLAWEQQIASRALHQLDESGYLRPSQLSASEQAQLRAGFDMLSTHIAHGGGTQGRATLQPYPGYAPRLRLELRSGMPANAFALPGGTVVMTDALVHMAGKTPGTGDAALLGVVAHELGHVVYRHSTRLVVEQGVLNVGLGLALGDVSSIVSMGASAVTGLAYHRSHENESDCYALALMRQAQLPTAPMADLLLALDDGAGKPASAPAADAPKGAAGAEPSAGGARSRQADWYSTHPNTPARAARLKSGSAESCAIG